MSKITFRADDDLVDRLEAFDASKSEVMRRALRSYLDETAAAPGDAPPTGPASDADGVDELIAERVDELVTRRVDEAIAERLDRHAPRRDERDINVNVSLDGVNAESEPAAPPAARAADAHTDQGGSEPAVDARKTDTDDPGDTSDDDVNAGDGVRTTCGQCGEYVGSGHVYCPNCGEKTSHRVFCECGDELRSDWGYCPSCGRRTPAADVLDRS